MPKPDVETSARIKGSTSATSSLYDQRSSIETVQATNNRPSTADSSLSERDGPQIQRIKKNLFNSNLPILRRARSNLSKSAEIPSASQEAKQSKFLNIPNTPSMNQIARDDSLYTNPFGSPPDDRKFGLEVSITGGISKPKKSSFAEKAAKFGKGAFSPENRQMWRSASGRAPVVEAPSRNTPTQSNYTLVRTPSRNIASGESGGSSSSDTSETWSQHNKKTLPSDEANLKQVSSSVLVQPYDETIKPTPPLKISKQRPKTPTQKDTQSPCSQGPLRDQSNSVAANSRALSYSSNGGSQVTRTPLASQGIDCENIPPSQSPEMDRYNTKQPKSHFSWTTYADSVVDEDERYSPENQQRGPQRGPTSHFSWSTVNTNTTYQTESPSGSPPAFTNSLQSTMMARRRPVPGHDNAERRHVSASQAIAHIPPISNPAGRRYASAAQVQSYAKPRALETIEQPIVAELEGTPVSVADKALPLPPDMGRGGSPIEVLQSQRDDLGVQHANLQKVIVELQKLDRASPLEVDEKSRRRNRQKLAGFREKLDEVQREEHEVGMALARAIRRAERAEGAENSGLWLRRITG